MPASHHVPRTEHGASSPGRAAACRPRAGDRRAYVLAIIRSANSPLGAAELAGRAGLHPNTIRWHLGQLTRAGLVTSVAELRATPGRPRLLYAARADPGIPAGDDRDGSGSWPGYRLLAGILASYVTRTSPDPAAAAVEAGHACGRQLAGEPDPAAWTSPAQAIRRVVRMLADLGFAPEPRAAGQIIVHACPFREVARSDPAVACGVHLGLMRGALADLRGPAMTASLEPFVTAWKCRAHISPGPGQPAALARSAKRQPRRQLPVTTNSAATISDAGADGTPPVMSRVSRNAPRDPGAMMSDRARDQIGWQR